MLPGNPMTAPKSLSTRETSIPYLSAEVHSSIGSIAAADWDICNGSGHKLSSHAYLRVLEESGVLDQMGGCAARLVVLRDSSGEPVAAAPAYLKSHSIGELGADFGFPINHSRNFGPYYPKLQVEIPLTPVSGPRLLVARGQNAPELKQGLIQVLTGLAAAEGASSMQISFMTEEDEAAARQADMAIIKDFQFVWRNRDYRTFDDFLRRMTKSRRLMVRRERRGSLGDDLRIEWIRGREISAEMCHDLTILFSNTFVKYQTENWYSEQYFSKLFRLLCDDIIIAAATRPDGEMLGAAMFLETGGDLIALQWGASEFRQFLMLETTIYQGIERAIKNQNATLHLGSLGRHKANRGALPTDIYHAYWFRDQSFVPIANLGIKARLQTIARERQAAMLIAPIKSDRLTAIT